MIEINFEISKIFGRLSKSKEDRAKELNMVSWNDCEPNTTSVSNRQIVLTVLRKALNQKEM